MRLRVFHVFRHFKNFNTTVDIITLAKKKSKKKKKKNTALLKKENPYFFG